MVMRMTTSRRQQQLQLQQQPPFPRIPALVLLAKQLPRGV
jgi:hypothetical protein